jgi:hypothetical protein
MKRGDVKSLFPSEAALCECFLASMRKVEGWTPYPETAGFDILALYAPTGHQLGIEAKLSLNAKVADQILPSHYMGFRDEGTPGPDFRAVIVPSITDASAGIAKMLRILGVMVWTPEQDFPIGWGFGRVFDRHYGRADHRPYDASAGELHEWDMAWHDWNPPRRCELPEIVPDVRCGVPAPLQLTPWKIGALRVLAQLELDGFVTAKSVRDCGVDARRFCASDGWLESAGGGRWTRGKVPAFDQQHPEAYAQVLAQLKQRRAA